jgi:hypothetical protein
MLTRRCVLVEVAHLEQQGDGHRQLNRDDRLEIPDRGGELGQRVADRFPSTQRLCSGLCDEHRVGLVQR